MTRRRLLAALTMAALPAVGAHGGDDTWPNPEKARERLTEMRERLKLTPEQEEPVRWAPVRAQAISPPAQPGEGPGGSAAPHAGIEARRFGQGAAGCWIFTPSRPVPRQAPIVAFLHGWGGIDPDYYGAWIEHIVRRGAIVIFPLYQDSPRSSPRGVLADALAGLKDGIARARSGELGLTGDVSRFAMVGHSAGGLLALNLASIVEREGLPRPRALMSVSPGLTETARGRTLIPTEAWETIPRGTLLLSLAGADDDFVGDADALRVYQRTLLIPAEDKDFVILQSDDHGTPALRADHHAATTGGTITGQRGPASERRPGVMVTDALDFYGTWKLFDALTDAAFYGRNREYALGDTPQQRFVGRWSDGLAVNEMIVRDLP
jgi:acetyl esterase/lipase